MQRDSLFRRREETNFRPIAPAPAVAAAIAERISPPPQAIAEPARPVLPVAPVVPSGACPGGGQRDANALGRLPNGICTASGNNGSGLGGRLVRPPVSAFGDCRDAHPRNQRLPP